MSKPNKIGRGPRAPDSSGSNADKRLAAILAWSMKGFRLLPLVPRSKVPLIAGGVYSATSNRRRLEKYFQSHPDANYGVATGSGFFVVDVDGKKGRQSLRRMKKKHGKLPKTVTVQTAKGRHYYFRSKNIVVKNTAGKLGPCIDVRGDGGYAVGPGSVHESGKVYDFVPGRALGQAKIAKAPEWLLKSVRKSKRPAKRVVTQPVPLGKLDRAKAYGEAARQRELDLLRAAPRHQRNNTLNRCAFKLGQLVPYGIADKNTIERDLAQVAASIGLNDAEIEPTINSGINAGIASPRKLAFMDPPAAVDLSSEIPDDDLAPDFAAKLSETDTDNAQRFARRFGAKAIYTPGHGWLTYDGRRWLADTTRQHMEMAKITARLIADEAQYLKSDQAKAVRSKFSKDTLSRGGLERMLELAKSVVAVKDDLLDADFWLFNTETGTINLRTGELEEHDWRDYLTKLAPVAADPEAKCPMFKTFLSRITANDKKLKTYIQKAVGYSLTGSTKEQVFFFCYGKSGNNGKSTLVNLIRDMLGGYGWHTATQTLMSKQYDNAIPTDLASLAGARMVTAIEANFNRQLDEARIKGMTGGEKINARFMRQNEFTFTPQFKLWFVANDRPRVRTTDNALWRRIRVIPFNVEIPDSERNLDLPEKLKSELPGILAWAVRGCVKWQANGLKEPAAIGEASHGWREAADHLKRFVTETLVSEPGYQLAASVLHDYYSQWCVRHGEEPLSLKKLKERLIEAHDMIHRHTNRGSIWTGVKIKLD